MVYVCENCGVSFSRNYSMMRHMRESCKARFMVGDVGGKQPRLDGAASTASMKTCAACNLSIPSNLMMAHQRTTQHRNNSCIPLCDGVQRVDSAFRSRIATYRISSDTEHIDFTVFFNDVMLKVLNVLEQMLGFHGALKVNMVVIGQYYHPTQDVNTEKSFNTCNKIVAVGSDLNELYQSFVEAMKTQSTEFQERDSGWALRKILYLEVNINQFRPIGGSSYIKLPKSIEMRGATVNVINQDQCCFAWAVTSALFPAARMMSQITSYPHYSRVLNLAAIHPDGSTKKPRKIPDLVHTENRSKTPEHLVPDVVVIEGPGAVSQPSPQPPRYSPITPATSSEREMSPPISIPDDNSDQPLSPIITCGRRRKSVRAAKKNLSAASATRIVKKSANFESATTFSQPDWSGFSASGKDIFSRAMENHSALQKQLCEEEVALELYRSEYAKFRQKMLDNESCMSNSNAKISELKNNFRTIAKTFNFSDK
ncbi:unnamed protein product [Ceutorhynchus assimilis]|uniref:C2H2-type domain-containing protein n=1 Tax=Ceutorhynchus assimilis TaxID=467358 RepID=A0A9N9MZ63_9CUCU|nr:unnamed protein product [Ceutorhynchus assimilis]